jgi:hypothetical protein
MSGYFSPIEDSSRLIFAPMEAPAGSGEAPVHTLELVVRSPLLNLLPNLTALRWALFSQLTPDLFGAPTAQGATAYTDGSALLQLPATLTPGTFFLVFTTSDGTVTQNPPPQSFAAPVTVT